MAAAQRPNVVALRAAADLVAGGMSIEKAAGIKGVHPVSLRRLLKRLRGEEQKAVK